MFGFWFWTSSLAWSSAWGATWNAALCGTWGAAWGCNWASSPWGRYDSFKSCLVISPGPICTCFSSACRFLIYLMYFQHKYTTMEKKMMPRILPTISPIKACFLFEDCVSLFSLVSPGHYGSFGHSGSTWPTGHSGYFGHTGPLVFLESFFSRLNKFFIQSNISENSNLSGLFVSKGLFVSTG